MKPELNREEMSILMVLYMAKVGEFGDGSLKEEALLAIVAQMGLLEMSQKEFDKIHQNCIKKGKSYCRKILNPYIARLDEVGVN